MSNWYGFNILPFDWRLDTPSEMLLSIDVSDFTQKLQTQCPYGEIVVVNLHSSTEVSLYISIEQNEPWIAASLSIANWTLFDVSPSPKMLALQLILWYRQYIEWHRKLFIVAVPDATGMELTENTLPADIEHFYPSTWISR